MASSQRAGGLHADLMVRLPFDLMAPRVAREAASVWMGHRDYAIPEETQDEVLLVVSELVTNAVRYGSEPVALVLAQQADPDVVRIQVSDGSIVEPGITAVSNGDGPAMGESGRGLRIVSRLSDWSWRRTVQGKWITADIDLPDEPQA